MLQHLLDRIGSRASLALSGLTRAKAALQADSEDRFFVQTKTRLVAERFDCAGLEMLDRHRRVAVVN